ncbi:MAG: ISNCY family transposase, partial [Methylococcaceae bacterium]|nr:ISNCY family transposase [Methylococcaceae bacterium]
MEDAALSAFSVFFTQSPSFLYYQRRMQKHCNRNNAQSVFGVHQIPSTSQIGNLIDPIAPETLYPMLAGAGDKLYAQGCLELFVS